jgi:hypothetical protein
MWADVVLLRRYVCKSEKHWNIEKSWSHDLRHLGAHSLKVDTIDMIALAEGRSQRRKKVVAIEDASN